MYLKKEIIEKMQQFTSYFRYHNKNLTNAQYEIIQEISEILDDIIYNNNGWLENFIEK